MVGHWLAVDREQPLAHGHALGRRAPGAHAQHHGWQALGAACGATHAACLAEAGVPTRASSGGKRLVRHGCQHRVLPRMRPVLVAASGLTMVTPRIPSTTIWLRPLLSLLRTYVRMLEHFLSACFTPPCF